MSSFRLTQVFFWLGLSIYFGGMVVLGGVAWQLFSILSQTTVHVAGMSPHLDQSRQLAGLLFGHILAVFNVIELLCLALMLTAVITQMVLHLNLLSLWVWLQATLLALLLVVTIYDVFVVFPATRAQQRQWVSHVDTQPAVAEAHRVRFFRWHRTSEELGALETVVLLGLLIVSVCIHERPTRKKVMAEPTNAEPVNDVPPQPAPPDV